MIVPRIILELEAPKEQVRANTDDIKLTLYLYL